MDEKKSDFTVEAYETWEGNWELVNGERYALPEEPVIKHHVISLMIGSQLDDAIDACGNGCMVFFQPKWMIDEKTLVQPNCAIGCHAPGKYVTETPKVVLELVAEDTVELDEIIKFAQYEAAGVAYYGLVYPDQLVTKIYRLVEGSYQMVGSFSDEVYTFEVAGCEVPLNFDAVFSRYRQ